MENPPASTLRAHTHDTAANHHRMGPLQMGSNPTTISRPRTSRANAASVVPTFWELPPSCSHLLGINIILRLSAGLFPGLRVRLRVLMGYEL